MPSANQSCTKVAPVRQSSGKSENHFMIEPVPSMTTAPPREEHGVELLAGVELAEPRAFAVLAPQPRSVVVGPAAQAPDVAAQPSSGAQRSARPGTAREAPDRRSRGRSDQLAAADDLRDRSGVERGARPHEHEEEDGRRPVDDVRPGRSARSLGRSPVPVTTVMWPGRLGRSNARPIRRRRSRVPPSSPGSTWSVSSMLEPLDRLVAVHRRDVEPDRAAVSDESGSPSSSYATSTSSRRAWASVRLSLYAPSKLVNRTACASSCTPARSSTSRSRTPFQRTSSTRHPVTHWKSRVRPAAGIARSSS